MFGIIVILAVSWIALYFLQKKDLRVLGFAPVPMRLAQFVLGLIIMTVMLTILILFETYIKQITWKANQGSVIDLLECAYYHIKSALTEELIFRGAFLYILIKRIGAIKAILVSSICFGIYHWFSYNMFGSGIVPMVYIFLITGFAGYAWAYAYAKTKSIMLPLGLHFGYNFINTLFYDNQPYGELLYSIVSMTEMTEWNGLFLSLFKTLMPSILTIIFIKHYYKEHKLLSK